MKKLIVWLTSGFITLTATAQSWNITGNAGTNSNIHFLGTTDNVDLKFRVGNVHAGEISVNPRVSLGYGAGIRLASGVTAIGYLALNANVEIDNTAVGAFALRNNTFGRENTALGHNALLANYSGGNNVALGKNALTKNYAGSLNVAIGRQAMGEANGSIFHYNVAVGAYSLLVTNNAQNNTAVGYLAGSSHNYGWNNTFIGANTRGSFIGQYNVVAVGQGTVCPDNSTARIGNSATWSIGGYAGWTNFSDGRYKKDIQENVKGLDFIMKLRPVTYHLDIAGVSKQTKENDGQEWDASMKQAIAEKEKVLYTGFVAQEVEQAAKASGYEFSGVDKPRNENAFYGLRYSEFVVPLVKGMQEQQKMIEELIKQNSELQKRIIELEKKNGINNNLLSVRPNPSTDKFIATIDADSDSKGLIKIYDSKGALVKMQQANLVRGVNQVAVDMIGLASGTYQVAAEWENGQVKKMNRIVKQ